MADGMHLANARDVPEAHVYETWRGRRNTAIVEEVQSMPLVMAVGGATVHAVLLAIFVDAGLPAWRVASVGAAFVVFTAMQRVMVRKARQERCIEVPFVALSVGAQLFVVTSAALT